MRALSVAIATVFAVALVGCGGTSRPEPQVHLQLSAPTDGTVVTSGSVLVSGKVTPLGARVLVLGHSVPVSHGAFSARVALQPGNNLLDVLAGMEHAKAVMTAIRVYRQILVTIPDVTNDSPESAAKALTALGLHVQVKDTDPFYAFLIPVGQNICSISPAAGHHVLPGAMVTISVSKTC